MLLRYALFIGFFAVQNVTAQEIVLDPVTVTSSLMEKRASETGRNIAVIKGDYFQNLPVNSIDELLRYVPGLEIQARGPMGSQSDIVLRGGTYQQVLVVLDGLRLNDPNTGHFNSYIPIAPSEIERIEVLKGASSAIYGSEAVGGVIHVISKTFAAKLNQENSRKGIVRSAVNAAATAGQYGLWNMNAGGFAQTNRLAISAGVQSNNADGVRQRGTNGYFHNNTASLSANFNLSPHWHIALRSSYDSRDFSAQNFYTTFVSDTANEQVKTSWNQLKIGYKKGRSVVSLDGGYKHVKDQYLYNTVSIRNESLSELWQGLLLWQLEISPKTSLVSGVNYQNKAISSNDRGEHTIGQVAPFVTLSHRFGEYFTVSPALRVDWREHIGTETVPQINLSYKRDGWQLRGSAGKTIRDADFTERFNNYNKVLVTGGSVGNPDLKAERSFSYEAGADWFLKNNLKLSATYFQRLHRNLIDFVTTPYAQMPRKDNLSPTGTFALANNIVSVNTTGVETDIQFTQKMEGSQSLWFNAGFTWLNSESSNQVPSFYVSSHAKFLANFSTLYQVGNFSVSISGIWKNRTARAATAIEAAVSKNYYVMNAKAEYGFLNRKLAVFVQADNLFNTRYSDLLGSRMPGSWLMGGVKFKLVK